MTIASAFNDIAVAQGGTAAKSGAITAAIDALNDALAGSDQPTAKTIEQAVRLLGEHIGGGGVSTVKCYILNMEDPTTAYNPSDVAVQDSSQTAIATEVDQVTVQGMTANCLSFAANIGASYYIGQGEISFVDGSIAPVSDPSSTLPSSAVSNGFIFVSPNEPFVALVEMSR